MGYITQDSYELDRVRPKLLTNYLEQMVKFLKLRHPNVATTIIETFVKNTITSRMKAPTVEAVYHKTEGNSELIKLPLDKYVKDIISDNNLSPSGTAYIPVSRKESFLRVSLEDKISARNKFKKLYLTYEMEGKKSESQYYNQMQANAKIFNNSIAGGMNIKQFILGCKAGFNAITSVGRMSVKQGYSYIERAVNGNIYLPSTDAAISYALNQARFVHDDFENALQQYHLYIPTIDEVVEYLITSVSNYVSRPNRNALFSVIQHLSEVERSYVFYTGCFKNICVHNEDVMRRWIDSCFVQVDVDQSCYKDIELSEIKKFGGDVVSCVLSTNYRRLGRNPGKKDQWNSIKDAIEFNPDGLREFIYVCREFVKNFETLVPLLKSIMQINNTFSKLVFQHRIARYTVPLSDTDSNIFSTQELVRWKRGKLDFSQESYEMNALVTFILSQSLEHVFAKLSAGFGIEKTDTFRISMKNEFLYPVLISTASAKHYLAIATMQEGSLLTVPRKDIKGVGLRSSAYPKLIRDKFEDFVVELFAIIEKAEPIRAAYILKHVADLEREVFDSINSRESVFLQTVSIKREEEYEDPEISSYFYYKLWTDVFSEDYGEMSIPNKCYKIPLKGGKRFFKNEKLMGELKENHPKIYEKLIAFVEKNPRRDVTSILIPPFKGKIHPFFLEIMDLREHISQSMAGYYHLLGGLGIGTVDKRVNGLVSDFYDPSTEMIE